MCNKHSEASPLSERGNEGVRTLLLCLTVQKESVKIPTPAQIAGYDVNNASILCLLSVI